MSAKTMRTQRFLRKREKRRHSLNGHMQQTQQAVAAAYESVRNGSQANGARSERIYFLQADCRFV